MLSIWKKTDANDKTATVQIDSFRQISEKIGANTPLYVITVVGEYHTGKSSLNNAVADEDVFEIASDIPPQTQGFEVVVLKDDCKVVEEELKQQSEYCNALLNTLRARNSATFYSDAAKSLSDKVKELESQKDINIDGEAADKAVKDLDAAIKNAKDAKERSDNEAESVRKAEENQNKVKMDLKLSPSTIASFAALTTVEAVEKEKKSIETRLTAKTKECAVERPAIVLCDTPGTSASDFKFDEQAALFGAAYILSSHIVYNTLRQVGSRTTLDWLADRLRYVLSVNASLPEEHQFDYNTAEVELTWVVQNVDLKNSRKNSKSQFDEFIDDHKARKYQLNTIFPNGIDPVIVPTPGDPDFVKKVTVADKSRRSQEYNKIIEDLRKRLFNGAINPVVQQGRTRAPRVFKNVEAWKNRTLDAFNSNVELVLRGYVSSIENSSKQIVEENMLKEAIARSIKDFDNKSLASEHHNKIVYAAMLQRLKEKYIAKAYERAVAVPRKKVEEEVKNELEKRVNGMIDTLIRANNKWIADNWEGAVSKEYRLYTKTIDESYRIPYDETTFNTAALRSQTKAKLDQVPKLAEDTEELTKNKAKLEEKMSEFDSTWAASNKKRVDKDVHELIVDDLEGRYLRRLKKSYAIPFDDVKFNANITMNQKAIKNKFDASTKTYLSSKSRSYDKYIRDLDESLAKIEKNYLDENRRKIVSIVKAWFNEKIYKPVKEIMKSNSDDTKKPNSENWVDGLYRDMKRIQTDNTGVFQGTFSYDGDYNMVFPLFLSDDRAFKDENVVANNLIDQHRRDLMDVHVRRVKNEARKLHKQYEDRINKFSFENEEIMDSIGFSFPTEIEGINLVIKSLVANCTKEFNADVSPYLKHIKESDYNFNQEEQSLQRKMSDYNDKIWMQFFHDPVKNAKATFHSSLYSCRYSDKYFSLECIKPSSIFVGLPSIKGEAERCIHDKIYSAVQADRLSQTWKSSLKKSHKSLKDASTARFRKIVKKTVDDWERDDYQFSDAYWAAYYNMAKVGIMIFIGYVCAKSSRSSRYNRTFSISDVLEAIGVLALIAFVSYALLFF